ncbi:MAG: hypothetical protein QOF14_1288 [Hyphomicrobiales bacterium]|jgi:hypothetical protein|nr:hypothetical protein [Hyphomicrobiales bacterium]
MYLVLLFVGLVVAAAGVALLGYAVPVEDLAGTALFVSGVVAIVGALIIAALAAAVRTLSRIAERLEIQPLPLPPVAAVGRDDPAPRPARAAAAVAAARPSLLGWLGRGSSPAPVRAARAPSLAMPEPEPAAPPVDLGPLTRIPDTAPPPSPVPQQAPPIRPQPRPAPVANPNGASATVYRSGVIDGMAYSLFMDGSIEAELPTGRVKFATIDELQQYLVSKK